jgi:hypothetical protein
MTTELESLVQLFKQEYEKFQTKQTAASATRARAHLLSIKKNADTLRKDILVKAKELKSSKTKAKTPANTTQPPVKPVSPKKTRKPRKPKKTS